MGLVKIANKNTPFQTPLSLEARLRPILHKSIRVLLSRQKAIASTINCRSNLQVQVLVHVHCRDFNIFSSLGLLSSDLVAQSVEQR